jgi:glycolate oxidase
MGIKEIRETTESCKHCYMCRHACPTFLATKLDSLTPRGYALLLSEIDHGFQHWTETIVDRFYQCSQCGLCREDCAYHWAEDEVVRNAREEIVLQKKAPPRVHAIAQKIIASGTPYENPAPPINTASAEVETKGAEVLYFPGCSTRQHHPEIISAVDKILGTLNIRWTILREQICCGTPLWELGYSEEARKVAAATVERISSLEPDILLTGCPHCARAFLEFYPEWGTPFPDGIRIIHTSQYLHLLLSKGTLKLKKNDSTRLSYHDPCQLGRKLGEYEAPRRIIEAITGSKPIELFHSRQAAECCGAGSIMHLTDADVARKVAGNRMESVRETGSGLLVTCCQNCKRSLSEAGNGESTSVEVLDLAEMVARLLG